MKYKYKNFIYQYFKIQKINFKSIILILIYVNLK